MTILCVMNTYPEAFIGYHPIFKCKLLWTHDTCTITLYFHVGFYNCNSYTILASVGLTHIYPNNLQSNNLTSSNMSYLSGCWFNPFKVKTLILTYSTQLCIGVCICKSDIIILILKLVNVYICTARFSKTQPLAT